MLYYTISLEGAKDLIYTFVKLTRMSGCLVPWSIILIAPLSSPLLSWCNKSFHSNLTCQVSVSVLRQSLTLDTLLSQRTHGTIFKLHLMNWSKTSAYTLCPVQGLQEKWWRRSIHINAGFMSCNSLHQAWMGMKLCHHFITSRLSNSAPTATHPLLPILNNVEDIFT